MLYAMFVTLYFFILRRKVVVFFKEKCEMKFFTDFISERRCCYSISKKTGF